VSIITSELVGVEIRELRSLYFDRAERWGKRNSGELQDHPRNFLPTWGSAELDRDRLKFWDASGDSGGILQSVPVAYFGVERLVMLIGPVDAVAKN